MHVPSVNIGIAVSEASCSQDSGGGVLVQIRAAALTATQCASYDLAKQWWMRQTGMSDNVGTHFGASMLTGLATTTITAPVDLVKTNMFVGETSFHHFCTLLIIR